MTQLTKPKDIVVKEPVLVKDTTAETASTSVAVEDVRSYNVGSSDYATKKIQPWSIWEEYNLNPWEADIVKRILRKKMIPGKTKEETRIEDLEKIIHVCKELIRQLKLK